MIVSKPNLPEFMAAPAGSLPAIDSGFLCALDHLGVIEASGDDAAGFLHNQLTNDILGLEQGHAELAGYCSPKGRLLATLLVWRHADQIFLALPCDVLPGFLKRLQMFVLRSKVTLKDVSDQWLMIGAATKPSDSAPAMWRCATDEHGTRIRVPDAAALQRWLWIGQPENARQPWTAWSARLPTVPASIWRWSEIIAGLPQVVETTREQFVPQMINFELVGGVNFKKGCYPGQEIVARSQYLGKTKRRTLLAFTSDTTASAGVEVFSLNDPDQPCGMVVNAEVGPDGRVACLVELKMEARAGSVHLRSVNGATLEFGELPYALNAET
ncbi:MAG: YgfZ/GcvT domain-containing protein [Betaproteobacteria bacterium]